MGGVLGCEGAKRPKHTEVTTAGVDDNTARRSLSEGVRREEAAVERGGMAASMVGNEDGDNAYSLPAPREPGNIARERIQHKMPTNTHKKKTRRIYTPAHNNNGANQYRGGGVENSKNSI